MCVCVRVCLRAESSETNCDTFHLQIALHLPLVQWGGGNVGLTP